MEWNMRGKGEGEGGWAPHVAGKGGKGGKGGKASRGGKLGGHGIWRRSHGKTRGRARAEWDPQLSNL